MAFLHEAITYLGLESVDAGVRDPTVLVHCTSTESQLWKLDTFLLASSLLGSDQHRCTRHQRLTFFATSTRFFFPFLFFFFILFFFSFYPSLGCLDYSLDLDSSGYFKQQEAGEGKTKKKNKSSINCNKVEWSRWSVCHIQFHFQKVSLLFNLIKESAFLTGCHNWIVS